MFQDYGDSRHIGIAERLRRLSYMTSRAKSWVSFFINWRESLLSPVLRFSWDLGYSKPY